MRQFATEREAVDFVLDIAEDCANEYYNLAVCYFDSDMTQERYNQTITPESFLHPYRIDECMKIGDQIASVSCDLPTHSK